MNHKKSIQFMCIIALISLSLTACTPVQIAEPTFTPTAAATLTPPPTSTVIPSPVPTSTATPIPTPSVGQLTGTMVWLTSSIPVGGAGIALCKMSGDTCMVDGELFTTSGADGSFEFQELDAGEYVILYSPIVLPMQVGGLSLDLSENSLTCLVQGMMGGVSPSCQGAIPIFGDGGITMQAQSSLSILATGNMLLDEGSLISEKFGVYLDFANGAPISVEILPGQTTETVFKAWDKK